MHAPQGVSAAPPVASTPYQAMDPQPGYSQRYNSAGGISTGAVQLICGILALVLGIVAHVMELTWSFAYTGIWSGIFFFMLSGILGIVSHRRLTGVIVGYMVMSILSAIVAFFAACTYAYLSYYVSYLLCPALNALDALGNFDDLQSAAGEFGSIPNTVDIGDTLPKGIINCEDRTADIAVNSCLAVVFFIEFIVSLIGSGLTCAGVCCGARPSVSTTSMTVISTQPGVMVKQGNMPIQPGTEVPPPNYYIN